MLNSLARSSIRLRSEDGCVRVTDVSVVDSLAEKLFVLGDFYEDINRIYEFSKVCPKRQYKVSYIDGMESVLGYPSQAAINKLKEVLGVQEIVDKTEEHSLFGLFRYLMAGESPGQIGVHVDKQPWSLIVYVSPSVEALATGFYRHVHTGVFDLGRLGFEERKAFVEGHMSKDEHNAEAWELVYATPFRQNTAVLFKSEDLLHSNVMTWGKDVQSARITQNFNFQVR